MKEKLSSPSIEDAPVFFVPADPIGWLGSMQRASIQDYQRRFRDSLGISRRPR